MKHFFVWFENFLLYHAWLVQCIIWSHNSFIRLLEFRNISKALWLFILDRTQLSKSFLYLDVRWLQLFWFLRTYLFLSLFLRLFEIALLWNLFLGLLWFLVILILYLIYPLRSLNYIRFMIGFFFWRFLIWLYTFWFAPFPVNFFVIIFYYSFIGVLFRLINILNLSFFSYYLGLILFFLDFFVGNILLCINNFSFDFFFGIGFLFIGINHLSIRLMIVFFGIFYTKLA